MTDLTSHQVFVKLFCKSQLPAQIRHLIFYVGNNKEQVDGFTRQLTFAKQLYEHFLRDQHPGDNPGANRRFSSQTPIKCYLPEAASVRDWLEICPWVASRVGTDRFQIRQLFSHTSNHKE